MDFSLADYMKHILAIADFWDLRSIVKNLFIGAVQQNASTLGGIWCFHTLLQGNLAFYLWPYSIIEKFGEKLPQESGITHPLSHLLSP